MRNMAESERQQVELIDRKVFEAMKKQHPIEASLWEAWIARGKARVVGSPEV
jgi:hypothetical protein